MTELEKKAEAFADEVEAEIGHCCGDNLNISAAELAARLAPLLVEVCEQREKVGFCEKHAPNPSQSYAGCWVCSRNEETELLKEVLRTLGWMKDKEAGWYLAEDSDAADGPKFYDFHDAVAAALDDYEVFRAAYKKSHLYGAGQQQRAEAAELALRKWLRAMDGRTPECAAEDLLNATATCSDLRAALQAREQKLAHEIAGQDYLRNQIIVLAKLPEYPLWTNTGLVEALKTKLAQARQQAVADLDPYLKHQPYCVMGSETREPCSCGLDERIRSLTPPPALTPCSCLPDKYDMDCSIHGSIAPPSQKEKP